MMRTHQIFMPLFFFVFLVCTCKGSRMSAAVYSYGRDTGTDKSLVPYVPKYLMGAINMNSVSLWLANGGDPNSKIVSGCHCCGVPLAALVIRYELVNILSLLLDYGLDPSLQWSAKYVPVRSLLKFAIKKDNPEIIYLLVDHGADLDFLQQRSSPPLFQDSLVKQSIDARFLFKKLMARRKKRVEKSREFINEWDIGPDVTRFIIRDMVGLT